MKNMKRVICWIITVMLVINMLPFAAFAADGDGQVNIDQPNTAQPFTFKVGEVSVPVTADATKPYTVDVPVYIANNTGFMGSQFYIRYDDDNLELLEISEVKEFPSQAHDPESEGNETPSTLVVTTKATTGFVMLDSAKIVEGNGELLKLTFKIKNPTQTDNYWIGIEVDELYGGDFKELKREVVRGSVTVGVAQIDKVYYQTFADAVAAAQDGDEIKIHAAGTYSVPSGKNITITGAVNGVVFDNIGAHNMGGASVTFNNVTFNYATNSTYKGLQHSGNLVYNECTFNGQVFLYGNSETFNNCTFNNTGDNYNVWTYGADAVAFNGCIFNSDGKSVLIYSEQSDLYNDVTVTESTFNATSAVDGKAAIEMDSSLTAGIKLTITNSTATGFGTGNVSGNSLWNNKKGNNTDANNDITVVVNGETVLGKVTFVAKIGEIGYTTVADAIKAITDGSTLTIFEGTYDAALVINKSNVTVIGIGNVTLNGVPSIKGTNYKVENIDFVYSTGSGNLSGSGLIKGCTFTATATNGNTFRYCYGTKDATITFENCAINAPNGWAIHFDSAPGMKLIFTGCEINGRVALSAGLGSLTATDTAFANGYVNVWGTVSGATFNTCDFVDVPYIFTGYDEDNTFYFNDCAVTVNGETKSVTDIIYGGNDAAEAEIYVDNVLKSGAAKIGNTYYKTLVEALAAAQDNDTITLLADATPALTSQRAITKAAVIDLNDYTLTLTQGDLYFGTTTFQNGKIVVDPSVNASTAVFWMFENQTLTFDKVDLVATGVTGTYLIGINGGSGTAVNILNSSITINNAATTALTAVICDNGKGNSVVIDKSDIDVKNIEGRFYLGGTNGTVTVNDSDLDLNGVKEGFYVRAGQHLTISGTSTVDIALNSSEGRYGINVTDLTATYTKAETATVNSTVYEPSFEATINGKKYATFAKALAAAQAGDTIELLADVTATEVIEIGKSITINGNGHKVTSSATRVFRVTTSGVEVTLNSVNMVSTAVRIGTNDVRGISIDILENVKLTLNNCSVDFTDASANDWAYAVNVTGGNKNTVTVNGGTYEGANVINVRGASQTVVVKDATLTSLYPDNDVYYGACIYVVQNENSSVTATGNIFNGANAVAFNVGYTPVTESNNTDNTTRVVAKVGDTYYTSLEDAFKAATSGCTIKILANVTVDGKWDCRYTGSKFTVPVTIDGNGKTITFTNTVYDGGNYMSAFRFEADATVINLTIDMSEALSGFAGRFRAISAKANLTVDGCTFIGNGSANNTRAIIFGEGAGNADAVIYITNSTFIGWRRGISDSESGKDVAETIVITGNTLNDASVYVSASEKITFNNNTASGEVDLRSYAAENVLSVEAQGNTLNTNVKNYIYAKTIEAQAEFTTKNPPIKVSTKAELNAALAAAKDGDIIVLTADIDYGTDQLAITKAITLDLGGKTLTTRNAWGGMSVKNNPTIKNGNIVHASNTAAIKVWNATAFENLVIDVQGKGDANKTIGGIVLQSGSTTRVGSIKNVTIKGAALTNGIETYNCGDATENVIGSMENVIIDAKGTGMLISAPCGTATNCDIKGGTNGIEIWIKGNYSASLDLVNSKVEGGVFAHDEFSSNPDVVNNGKLSLTVDAATTGVSVADVTVTIARAEKFEGVIKDVIDKAQAKINNTYYITIADAIKAAKAGDVVTVFEGTYAVPSMKAGITIVGDGDVMFEGTLTGTLENLTLKNIHIKGGNAQRWAYAKGDLVFENVTFEATSVYALHFDGITAGATLLYKDCTIIGWAAMSGSPASCVFDGCTIKGNGTYGLIRTYFNATIKDCTFDVANVNTNDAYQDGIHAVDGAVVTVDNCTNKNGEMADIVNVHANSVVIVDGVEIKNVAKIGGNYYGTIDAAFAAAQNGDVVEILVAGTYSVPSGKNITITGAVDGVIFDNIGAHNMGGASVTFNNVTFDYYPNVNYTGLQHSGTLVYNNCTFNGQVFLYGASETFNKCAFNQNSADAYNVWTYGAKKVAFNECTFNSVGKAVLVYTETKTATTELNVVKTTFNASAPVDGKAAIEIDTSLSAGATITIDAATTAKGFGTGNVSGNSLWNNKKDSNTDANNDITVVVGGSTVLAPVTFVAKIGNTGYTTINAAIAAAKAGETVNVFAGTYAVPSMKAGITLVGEVNADGTPAVLFNGTLSGTLENLTLKNIHIKGGNAQRWAYAKGDLVFENVTFEATSVYALHFDGIATGTNLTYKKCTIIGWAAMGGSPASCVFDGCTIKGNGTYGLIRTYFDATIKNCTFDVANVNTSDVYQDGIHAVEGAKVTVIGCTNVNGAMADIVNVHANSVVTVDGVEIKNVAKINGTYYKTLAEAIAAVGAGDVVIELVADATLDYNARDAYGTADTTSLTINGNGHTLTLNQKNSDWASIGLANANAKLVLNDMTIEKTGYGDTSGTWNTHAIIFSCDVEMNRVTVNNAIAVAADATLTNVTINEANGYYGLWIEANGQTVTVTGGAINATNGGRGIKIADQYINSPESVTLNVTDTVFNTSKKAAVLVSSTAGAKTTASNVNIENVAEDKVNFVWVDEDWAANFGKVTVNDAPAAQENLAAFNAAIVDGNKVVGYYKTLEAAIDAAQADDTITLLTPYVVKAGETLTIDKNVTISRTHGSEYAMIHVENGATLTINNGKITYAAGGNNTGAAIWVEGALIQNGGIIEVTGSWSLGFAVDVRPNAWGTAHTVPASFVMNGGAIASTDTAVRVASNSSDVYEELGVTFTMNGGTITSDWDAIFVQHLYAGDLNVNIENGTVSGYNSALRIYGGAGSDIDMIVKGGNFTGEIKVADAYADSDAIVISGGTFTQDVAKWCAAGYRVEKNAANGTWTVLKGILGDVSGDGALSSKDVVLLRQYVAGFDITIQFNVSLADVNNDGVVSSKDVVKLRQIIVGNL